MIFAKENLKYRMQEEIERSSNNYYGVKRDGNRWASTVYKSDDGSTKFIGLFDNEIAAANARDWWAKFYIDRENKIMGGKKKGFIVFYKDELRKIGV